MFTGIIEEVGTVAANERGDASARFTVAAETIALSAGLGDSITINGACLTVVERSSREVSFDVVYETMQRTAFGALAIGDQVNLERSLLANGRFGGHIVQGHIDGTGTIASIREIDNSYYVYVTALSGILRYIVRKGSIAIDGISLTVVEADEKTFSVSIIPYTWEHTNLHTRRAGDLVNLETDVIGKYVEKLIGGEFGRQEAPTRIADLVREEKSLLGATTSYLE
jgi:riboflavin synthase